MEEFEYLSEEDKFRDADRERHAIRVYMTYADAVGGTTWDGAPIPAFRNIAARQRNGWRAVADLSFN